MKLRRSHMVASLSIVERDSGSHWRRCVKRTNAKRRRVMGRILITQELHNG